MEKTTKKKKSKRLKRRIGLIAVGGLSLVLTVCLSVGATLAWFAGSTYASNNMYMGGPVYVEMAGRGHAGSTAGTGTDEGKWVGGDGRLDIVASARLNGTAGSGINHAVSGSSAGDINNSNVLLPGQKLLVYSQARVYSTAYYDDITNGYYKNQSSGANTTNITNGTAMYTSSSGKKKTTTTSVLRAKFSIDVEYDPSVGFNNFNTTSFTDGYPVQSGNYTGDGVSGDSATWDKALGATFTTNNTGTDGQSGGSITYEGRRDKVTNSKSGKSGYTADGALSGEADTWVEGKTAQELWAIKNGASKCIYEWKFVDFDTYEDAAAVESTAGTGAKGIKMGAPFDGNYNTLGTASKENSGTGNGYYGIFVTKDGKKQESDAFYKERCDSYLLSCTTHYVDEYDRTLILTLRKSLNELETELNKEFEKLVNKSSDAIIDKNTTGFTVNETTGEIKWNEASDKASNASWLYVDPTIGNDTNASDSATSTGGWWYLVACNDKSVTSGQNEILAVRDALGKDNGKGNYIYDPTKDVEGNVNSSVTATSFVRGDHNQGVKSGYTGSLTSFKSTDSEILNAQLFEICPDGTNGVLEQVGSNGTYKVVSQSFPFVNGSFPLPGKALTNNFANAKITFKITFQAVQAFFPYSNSIDGCPSDGQLSGTAKALNIYNAIPIFNEAFDYLSYLSD